MNFRFTMFVRYARAGFMCLCLSFVAAPAPADVKMHSLFTDHMVLQRSVKLPVWGTADAGEVVTVAVGGRQAQTTAGADGKWKVTLDSLSAPGPFTLTVTGKNTITLRDVMVGEVWVCSGQSNMQWRLIQASNGQQEVAEANYPNIRLFNVPRVAAEQPQAQIAAQWQPCEPRTAFNFSAVAYFFGRELHKTLNVPIGLIHSSWGGTTAEAWTPRSALEADPALREVLPAWVARNEAYAAALQAHREQLVSWEKAVAEAKAAGQPEPAKPKAPEALSPSSRPASLYNGMIAPLIPFAIKGVIWYQGESNATRAARYRVLFPTLIQSWRINWGQGEFPFIYVQLANYMKRAEQPGESFWAELREAQLQTLSVPRTGMAVAIDIGEADDIHPANKQDVGRRLALAALANEYGQKLEYSGPLFQEMKIEGNAIRLHFKHANGLKAAGDEPLQGFAIAGEDRQFVWANARIDGNTVVVSSEQVPQPVAVRYGWANNPAATLYNAAGLPASPFRTDNWPRPTK